jgi:hypothetical protein
VSIEKQRVTVKRQRSEVRYQMSEVLVPTLCVGMHPATLCVVLKKTDFNNRDALSGYHP